MSVVHPNTNKSPETAPQTTSKRLKLILPWVTTSLLTDLRLLFVLQPLLWLAGLELLLAPVIAIWLLIKRLVLSLKLHIPRQAWWLIIFSVWQLAHFVSLPPGELDLFVKAQGTWLSLISLYIVIYNVADSRERWNYIVSSIEIFGFITACLGLLYITGIFNLEFQSLIGQILPGGLVANSHFFTTISTRSLGFLDPSGLPRVRSTFWHPSSYASILLVFLAIQWFQFSRNPKNGRKRRLFTLLLLLINLVFTLSRTTYVAFLGMVFFIWWLETKTPRSRLQKLVLLTLGGIFVLLYLLVALLSDGAISYDFVNSAVYDFRPNSVLARVRVYEISWELVRQKPIWGWGTFVKAEGLPSAFSAGSHSDYLSNLFQFGIPGLLLYLSFFVATWYTLLKGYFTIQHFETKRFFAIGIALMLAINLRQVTSELLWDAYVAGAIWSMWALVTALYRIERVERQS